MLKNFRVAMVCASAGGAMALAGCGGQNAGGDDAASGDAGGALKSGQWEATLTLTKVEVAEKDPEIQAFFQSAVGQTNESKSCLSEADAAKPKESFFQGENADCTYDKFTMSGGKIDSMLTCKDGGGSMTVTMTGTYTEDSYQIESTAEGELLPETKGKMAMKASGKRTGDCTPEPESPAEG